MSLLPQQIIPQTVPFAKEDAAGNIIIEKNWWLLLYNLVVNTFGSGITAEEAELLAAMDADIADADAVASRRPLSNLQEQLLDALAPPESQYPGIARALLLAQDALLPDSVPLAQPVVGISVGASPFTYTAPFWGTVTVSGAAASSITIVRRTASIATGLTSGLIPVARYDQVTVVYSGSAPTMFLIPGSTQ